MLTAEIASLFVNSSGAESAGEVVEGPVERGGFGGFMVRISLS